MKGNKEHNWERVRAVEQTDPEFGKNADQEFRALPLDEKSDRRSAFPTEGIFVLK